MPLNKGSTLGGDLVEQDFELEALYPNRARAGRHTTLPQDTPEQIAGYDYRCYLRSRRRGVKPWRWLSATRM